MTKQTHDIIRMIKYILINRTKNKYYSPYVIIVENLHLYFIPSFSNITASIEDIINKLDFQIEGYYERNPITNKLSKTAIFEKIVPQYIDMNKLSNILQEEMLKYV
jgi:hypothetical protein